MNADPAKDPEIKKHTFHFFWGGPYSQWALSYFKVANRTFNCAEQWMMACKALHFGDKESYNLIMNATDPATQKQLGKGVRGFDVDEWTRASGDYVVKGNYEKFTQNFSFLKFLFNDRDKCLVEASATDRIWGIGLAPHDPRCQNPNLWQGENRLGESIMKAREKIFDELGLEGGFLKDYKGYIEEIKKIKRAN